jgi:hypothetical protein
MGAICFHIPDRAAMLPGNCIPENCIPERRNDLTQFSLGDCARGSQPDARRGFARGRRTPQTPGPGRCLICRGNLAERAIVIETLRRRWQRSTAGLI